MINMKKLFALLLALLMTVCLAEGEVLSAQTVLECFAAEEYEELLSFCSEEVRAVLTPEALAAAWNGQLSMLGALQDVQYAEQQGFSVALLTHEKGRQQLIVGLNDAGEIQTLLIQPVQDAAPAEERALPEGVEARDAVLFESTEKELKAQILVPAVEKPVYAVLIHGSGPSDMDETIGGCKPFRDLAYDLAALGIGTIRFDKMTYVHPEQAQTVSQEYLEPVAEALRVLRQEMGAETVVAVGHSQGGMLMPWLVKECGFDGGVALAGTPRQLWEISWQQNLAILETMPQAQREAAQAQIDAEYARAQNLENLADSEVVFGMPAIYLKELAAHDQITLASEANVPMLMMWGNADFQVSREDFEAWKVLGESELYTYIEYEGLNHLFMPAWEGDSVTNAAQVYARGGEMDPRVAADIAAWLANSLSM